MSSANEAGPANCADVKASGNLELSYSEVEKVIRRAQTNAIARNIISNSIQRVLATLDEPISRALMYHLCQVSEAAGDDLLLNYKSFENGLYSVLGVGANLLMEKIREDLHKYAADFVKNGDDTSTDTRYSEQAAIDEILRVISETRQARLFQKH
jgi:hypothetical protein